MPNPKIGLAMLSVLAILGMTMHRLPLWSLCMSAGLAAFLAASIWPKERTTLKVAGWGLWVIAVIVGVV